MRGRHIEMENLRSGGILPAHDSSQSHGCWLVKAGGLVEHLRLSLLNHTDVPMFRKTGDSFTLRSGGPHLLCISRSSCKHWLC